MVSFKFSKWTTGRLQECLRTPVKHLPAPQLTLYLCERDPPLWFLGLYKIWQCLKSSLTCKHIQQNNIAIAKAPIFYAYAFRCKSKSHEIQLKFDHSQMSVPLFVCSDRRWQWQLRVLACAEMLQCDCGIETHVVVQCQQQFSGWVFGVDSTGLLIEERLSVWSKLHLCHANTCPSDSLTVNLSHTSFPVMNSELLLSHITSFSDNHNNKCRSTSLEPKPTGLGTCLDYAYSKWLM